MRQKMEGLAVRSDGDNERWLPPSRGHVSGHLDFQPMPPCMADMCNATGGLAPAIPT